MSDKQKKKTDEENNANFPTWLRNLIVVVMTVLLMPIVAEVVSELIIRRMDATPAPEITEVAEIVTVTAIDTLPPIVESSATSLAQATQSPIPVASAIPTNTSVEQIATPNNRPIISLSNLTVPRGIYNLAEEVVIIDRPYRIDEFEVIREDFASFLQETSIVFDNEAAIRLNGVVQVDASLPMVQIKAEEAQAYCESLDGRLPSQEEWLVAYGIQAREGVVDLSISTPLQANIGSGSPQLREGGLYQGNHIGLRDMIGNVSEWAIAENGMAFSMGGSILSRQATSITDLTREVEDMNTVDIRFQGFRCIYNA